MHARSLALVVAALLAAPTVAAEKISKFDRFQLWADCLPMNLVVSDVTKSAPMFGLTTEAVEIAVRSRLRAARLYDATTITPYLDVGVRVLDIKRSMQPFVVKINLYKSVKDETSGLSGPAVAWMGGAFGLGDPAFVLSAISQHSDKFIDEYLRVNADACGKQPKPRISN